MYRRFGKRFLDLLLVIPALIALSPVFITIGLILKSVNKSSGILFLQNRPGKNGRIFRVLKFKTMTDERDSTGKLRPDAIRLTSLGKFLRSTSLDELPQLINVLKGDMTLIGPRPLLPKYLPLYSEEQAKRHDVKPGLTGWAQINGRNLNTWNRKLELDVWYVNHVSFFLDVRIMLMTIMKIIIRDGINKEGEATTTAFDGNN